MNYPTEFQEMVNGLEIERAKHKCSGACFCTGRCMYTQKEWDDLQKIKDQYKFTGAKEMLNKIGD